MFSPRLLDQGGEGSRATSAKVVPASAESPDLRLQKQCRKTGSLPKSSQDYKVPYATLERIWLRPLVSQPSRGPGAVSSWLIKLDQALTLTSNRVPISAIRRVRRTAQTVPVRQMH